MAINASAHIKFKHGSQANLNHLRLGTNGKTANDIEVGAFYLTDDTHRLYLGVEEGAGETYTKKIVAVNEGIVTYEANNFPGAGIDNMGQFAYVSGTGILCVSNGKAWVQLNHNTDTLYTYEGGVEDDGTAGNTVTVSQTLQAINNTSTTPDEAGEKETFSFILEGKDGIILNADSTTKKITVYGSKLTYTTDTYSTNKGASIQLKDAEDNLQGAVNIEAGNNITITDTTAKDGIKIAAKDTVLNGETPLHNGLADGGFLITAKDTNDNISGTKIDPVISYGETPTTVKFINGTATLNVYTKEEVDNLRSAFDAMEYQGVTEGVPSGITIKKGYTWKASKKFTVNGQTVEVGDLIIANGVEVEGVLSAPTWDIVPSGNEDTQYSVGLIANGISIMEKPLGGSAEKIGHISVVGDNTVIEVTASPDTDDCTQDLTVKHKTVTRQDPALETKNVNNPSNADFTVDSEAIEIVDGSKDSNGIVSDSYGHITAVHTKSYTIHDTNAILASMSTTATTNADKNVGSVAIGAVLNRSNGDKNSKSTTFKIASQSKNLQIDADTSSTDTLNLALVWDTF